MPSQLQLVERVQSEAGWSSEDTRLARFALEKIVHNESLRGAKVRVPSGELDPIAYYLGLIGLEPLQNSSYSMIEKSQNNPDYKGVIEMRLAVKNNIFRMEILDNGMGIRDEFKGVIFDANIKPYKQHINGLNDSCGQYLLIVADMLKKLNGTFGFRSLREGAKFWYELPYHHT